jgi:hypothetical protein
MAFGALLANGPECRPLALGKKSNAADGRFGPALRGPQAFPISTLSFLDGRSARLRKDALTSEMPEGRRPSGLDQRFPSSTTLPCYVSTG